MAAGSSEKDMLATMGPANSSLVTCAHRLDSQGGRHAIVRRDSPGSIHAESHVNCDAHLGKVLESFEHDDVHSVLNLPPKY